MVLVGEKTNTVVLTLDLYGAVALADYDAALTGVWKNLTYQTTSIDGIRGTSFPDRAQVISIGENEYLLVANASENGGLALFDLAKRQRIQTFPASAGSETPIALKKSQRVVTVISGKIKGRSAAGLNSRTIPGTRLLVFDFAPMVQEDSVAIEEIEFDAPLFRVEALNPDENEIVLLAEKSENTEWIIYNLAERKELHRLPAHGPVSRIAVSYDTP